MIITKIRADVKDEKIHVCYKKLNNGGLDDYSLSCNDPASPSFHRALQLLVDDFLSLCELPKSKKDKTLIIGVTFSYNKEGIMSAVITGQIHLDSSIAPLVINTPVKASGSFSEKTDNKSLFSGDCVERLTALQKEAELYVNGIRAQTEMFGKEAA